jgi:PST family polysaccharide transporter
MTKKIKLLLNSKEKKRLLSNFFSLSILQLFSYILPLITLPYLVRVLGIEKFGLVMFAQAFIMFFSVFVDFGFNLSAVREVSIYRNDKDKLSEIVSSIMVIKLILILISLIILTIIVFTFNKFQNNKVLYYLTFLMVIGQAIFPIWYFQGIERMGYITIINITSKLLFTISIFIFVNKESDYLLVPFLNGLGFILGGGYSLYLLYNHFGQKIILQPFSILKKYIYDSFFFFLSRISSIGYSSINTFLIGLFLTDRYVSYYYLADKIINIIILVFNPLVQTLYPYFSKSFNISFFKKTIKIIIIVSIITIFLVFLFKNVISLILLNKKVLIFENILNILLLLIPINLIYVFLGAPLLLARGYKKEFNISIIIGFILHIFILSILIVIYKFFKLDYIELLYLFSFSIVISKVLVLLVRVYYIYKYNLYKG